MTRNLYIGASTTPVIMAAPQDVPFRVAEAFQVFLSTSFEDRMAALAREIGRERPHLVGLQEVTTLRLQSPGDLVLGGTVEATDVIADFEATLLSELAARGLDYRIVARIQNADLELPMFVGVGGEGPLFDDLRITDSDMILVRGDVEVTNVTEENFSVVAPLPRGWVAVDATVRGETYRFVNTHLEAFSQGARLAQATELIASLAGEVNPVIAVGDFNTEATGGVGAAYQLLGDAGYEDVWPLSRPGRRNPGFTCCFPPDLLSPASPLDQRIDFIFVRDGAGGESRSLDKVKAQVVGESRRDRLRVDGQRIWPSDHAGVSAQLTFEDDDHRRKRGRHDKDDDDGHENW